LLIFEGTLMYPVSKRQTGPSPQNLFSLSPTQPDEWEVDREEIQMNNKLGMGQYGDVYEAIWSRPGCERPVTVAVKTLKVELGGELDQKRNRNELLSFIIL
jgi:hypothetical protein